MTECNFTLFYPFGDNVHGKLIDLENDTFKFVLSNSVPTRSWSQLSSLTPISDGNGYTTGSHVITVASLSQTLGVTKWITSGNATITASGGEIGPFRSITVYDYTSTNNLLVGYMDYGSSISIPDTKTLTILFDGVELLVNTQL